MTAHYVISVYWLATLCHQCVLTGCIMSSVCFDRMHYGISVYWLGAVCHQCVWWCIMASVCIDWVHNVISVYWLGALCHQCVSTGCIMASLIQQMKWCNVGPPCCLAPYVYVPRFFFHGQEKPGDQTRSSWWSRILFDYKTSTSNLSTGITTQRDPLNMAVAAVHHICAEK